MIMGFPTIRVLFVTTEPKGLTRPDTTAELQHLQAALRGGRASFHVDNVYHATRSSLMDALDSHRPEIVHFLAHGNLEGAFVEDRDGGKTLVDTEWLTSVFERRPEVRLVVLNACMSAVSLARPLVDSARTKIRGCLGWSDRVLEADARSFAVDFYERIAAGDSVHAAFRSAIDESSEGFADQAHPVLALRGGADFRAGLWRAVHFAALGGAATLLGLIGLGLGSDHRSTGAASADRGAGPPRAEERSAAVPARGGSPSDGVGPSRAEGARCPEAETGARADAEAHAAAHAPHALGFDAPGSDATGFDAPGCDEPGFDEPGFDEPGFDACRRRADP
jgi:hypothetical protein